MKRLFLGRLVFLCLLPLAMGTAVATESAVAPDTESVVVDGVDEASELAEPVVALPQPTEDYKLKSEGQDTGARGTSDIGEVFMGLMAILGLIALLAWTTKRLNINGVSTGNYLKMQSVLSLGSKEKVVVVEVEGKKLLLGVTSQNVNLLCHLDDSADDDRDDADNEVNNNEMGSFAQQIKKALAQGKIREDSQSS